MFDNQTIIFYFLFLKKKNNMFLKSIFLVVFTLFFKDVLKNNYTYM